MRSLVLLAVVLLLGFANSARLLHADVDVADIVPDQYIIVLKNGLTSLEKSSHMLELKDHINTNPDATIAEEVRGDFDFGGKGKFKGFFATLSKAKLAEQLAHPNVKYVEMNKVVRLLDQTPSIGESQKDATWGLVRTSQRYLPLEKDYHYNWTTISEVDAYIIDTGVLTTHQDFGGRAFSVFNAVTNEPAVDENGHGTHCAGTVGGATYGIHKGVTIYAVKVLGRTGSGTWEGVIAGINFVGNNHHKHRRSVANMSLGGGRNTAVDDAVNAASDNGVAMVVASGNNNWDSCQYSPAAAAKAISVGATNIRDARASFSNYGPCTHIYAPGEAITSDWIGASNEAINTISGTSMAAPHVCGVIALHRDWDPSATPLELRAWAQLVSTAGVISGIPTSPPSVNFLLYSPHTRPEVTANV